MSLHWREGVYCKPKAEQCTATRDVTFCLFCASVDRREIMIQRCPTYQLHFPPKRWKWGPQNPKSGPGNSGKFRVSAEFPQKPLVRVIPGNSFWGPHFWRFGGFSGGNENGQSWYVGHGWVMMILGALAYREVSFKLLDMLSSEVGDLKVCLPSWLQYLGLFGGDLRFSCSQPD